jgi:hypothetical protein
VADDLDSSLDPSRKRTTYLLVALGTVLLAAVVVVIATR